jgi:flagellar basal body P-ring protein FlgI
MKKLLLLICLLAVSVAAFPQQQQDKNIVLGIGNADISYFDRAIEVLTVAKGVNVINTCISHRIIVISNRSDLYKTEFDLVGFLKSEIADIVIYIKKDDRILFNECAGEIEKQNREK